MKKTRSLAKKLLAAAESGNCVILSGPRQSGKTFLVRQCFPHFDYALLESPDIRLIAKDDPRGFLRQGSSDGLIIDEAQLVPELFSYLQEVIDDPSNRRKYILTGSQNFLLMESVTQSLAGRAALLTLLPFSQDELWERTEDSVRSAPEKTTLDRSMLDGFYPPIHDRGLNASEWLADYTRTYLERDVRTLTNVGDIDSFYRFLKICSGRNGQILDLLEIGNEVGVSQPTAQRWLSVLIASFQVFLVQPYFKNFNKRIIKRPKLYFFDTGLVCHLLGITTEVQLASHPLRGAIFESYIIADIYKTIVHQRRVPDIYFWRDSAGKEIDLIVNVGGVLNAIEVKSGSTFQKKFSEHLSYWQELEPNAQCGIVYGGDRQLTYKGISIQAWYANADVLHYGALPDSSAT
jgi:uncharacterized protein